MGKPGKESSRRNANSINLSVEDAILDAAETLFAERGIDATSVRTIGAGAGVNPALVHYYFESKEKLLQRVIERRSTQINAVRRERLLGLFANSSPVLPALEDILEAIIRPTIEFGRDEKRGGHSYTHLIDTLSTASDNRSVALISENFDPIARYSIECMQRVVPGLTKAQAVDCYLGVVKLAFQFMSPTGRARMLAGGDYAQDTELAIKFTVRFTAAGIRATSS